MQVMRIDLGSMFDEGRHKRAKIGFVLLATEQTIEDDMMALMPDGVGAHFARVAIPDSITLDSLTAVGADLARAASTLLPDGSLDVISYACTSGSLVLGEDSVFQELRKGAPDAIATSLITSVIHALKTLAVEKIAVCTPYLEEVNLQEKQYLEDRGFYVTKIRGLNLEKDSDMIRVRPDVIEQLAHSVNSAAAEAVFISCGALRSIEVIERLEDALNKPVVCSNQAMAWDVLRKAGVRDQFSGYGRLLRDY
ncbi:arylmalonate decarboxylase [Ruegeria sp. Ofav3-42]|uniref:maleate cis-trans isomerase family protein n=1 Tax=Ruegeria sp. Ofav3-42 TaxID=2917759 RepID=UPI001EF62C7A|nr:arylmalonate decarboxylase [Ruegeria sp. Ofav3-42]MCG7522621.1 arylmalonate decarboxylase [Ruegeria sp. Ofav3-42]